MRSSALTWLVFEGSGECVAEEASRGVAFSLRLLTRRFLALGACYVFSSFSLGSVWEKGIHYVLLLVLNCLSFLFIGSA